MKVKVSAVVAALALAVTCLLAPAAYAAPPSKQSQALERVREILPADWAERLAERREELRIESSPAQRIMINKVEQMVQAQEDGETDINPDDYTCGPTKLDGYINEILADVKPETLFFLFFSGALDMPTYEALIFGTPRDPDFALPKAYEKSLTTAFSQTQRFWDVRLNDVRLVAMYGEMITDVDRVARTAQALGLSPSESVAYAEAVAEVVESDPALENGANPIFTLNAFAFSADPDEQDPQFRRLPDKIVMGDGILAAMKGIGLNRAGPRAVLAHEMAHHVQYEKGFFDTDLPANEATRRTELMADAFASYSASHKKGLNLIPARVLEVQESFYAVGDCQFDSPGHHGTPNQRRAAAAWGTAEVAYADNPNRQYTSQRLFNRFEEVYPQLIAPDAPNSPADYRAMVEAA